MTSVALYLQFLTLGTLLAVAASFLTIPFFSASTYGISFRSEKSQQPLFGISEWRSSSLEKNRTVLVVSPPAASGTPNSIDLDEKDEDQSDCFLVLPGQSCTVVWTEGRQLDALDEASNSYANIIGIYTEADDDDTSSSQAMISSMLSLCEITAYSIDAGFRGKVTATVTLKCVGRARLVELKQAKPLILGLCHELFDEAIEDVELNICEEVKDTIEQLLRDRKAQNMEYQAAFWKTLTALDYKPTTLLTRDPLSTNTRKELEAASWAALSTLADRSLRLQGLSTTSLLERLQIGRNSMLEEQLLKSEYAPPSSTTSSSKDLDDGFLDEGFQ